MQENPRYEMSVTEWLQYQAADFYVTMLQKLVPLYSKCLNSGGEYIEKWLNTCCICYNKYFHYIGVNGETYFVDALRIYTMSVLPKGRSFTANAGTKVAVLSKGRSSTPNSGTKVAVLLGINRCGSFP